jgi:hypothetical protein
MTKPKPVANKCYSEAVYVFSYTTIILKDVFKM